MSVHQVITGALNKGENVYATGCVEGTTFTVCAVGKDVVILAADFSRVQIIPGSTFYSERLVSSVSCCPDSGKIAATYGNVIRIFEPTSVQTEKTKPAESTFSYKWVETQCFSVSNIISTVLWNMDGLRMLVVTNNELELFQHRSLGTLAKSSSNAPVMFCIAEEESSGCSSAWESIWTLSLYETPKYIRYSPDGAFLAVSGEEDCLVKIFYQELDSYNYIVFLDCDAKEPINFNFVTLHHPEPVRGIEWRRTGRYMPRKCIQSVLMTWCADNTSRIWKETPPAELSVIDISGDGGEPAWEHMKPRTIFGKHIRVKKTRNKIMNKLKGLVPEKKKRPCEDKDHAIGLRAQIGRSGSMSDLNTPNHSYANVEFHLAAAINADTDCLLVPSMESSGKQQKPFCVHWLNNKELVFSQGAERLLAEALVNDNEHSQRLLTSNSVSPIDPSESEENHSPQPNGTVEKSDRPISAIGSVCSETPSSKDLLDVKLEILLRQWSKSTDILFTIHPVDGSLLVWTIEWLDDLHRQPTISFTSRFPGAFPITDASSLHPTLNTFNPHEPMYIDVIRHDAESAANTLLERRPANTVHVLTNHDNGSLNLWHMTMEDRSNYTVILNITHISRMCGHRFQINQVVAHPVLPLLLTSSQFKSTDFQQQQEQGALSEVILWKISPVGPLCKSGGVSELARVANQRRQAFSYLSWIPAILPSCTLGTVCNSPSSCFIASDGQNLVIYQAVVDARGLLSEIYDSARQSSMYGNDETRSLSPSPRKVPQSNILQEFNVVSTQSTARPGCVLEVGKLANAVQVESLHLLHVFNECLVINEMNHDSKIGAVVDRSKTATFCDRFLVVIIEKGEKCDSFVMYSLVISSQQPQPIPHYDIEDIPDEKGFLRPASPLAHSVARLHFESKLVCRQEIPLPGGVRIVSAVPSAGHLSSSSIYPACQAPYVITTSCDDDTMRFWRCNPSDCTSYEWSEWNMVSNRIPSQLDVEGSIYCVSAAHTGRIACAYDPRSGGTLLNAPHVEVGVFECESSGGVEWMREDTLSVKNIHVPRSNRSSFYAPSPLSSSHADLTVSSRILGEPSDDLLRAINRPNDLKVEQENSSLKNMIRIDWVSTEDGAHILTVGVADTIYLYTQISHDPAQQNVILMKESETTLRRPSLRKASSLVMPTHSTNRLTKWVCNRILKLESADGLPPVPTTLSWARDGLLIVGMPSEMRIYNQWNFKPKVEDNHITRRRNTNTPVSITISSSYSTLDSLQKKKELLPTKSRLRMDMTNKIVTKNSDPQNVLEALSEEGLFEAARMSSPILPQYHPKQLIVLLNAGKTKRVKAILLHVLRSLRQHQVTVHNPLSRAASVRRMSTVESEDFKDDTPRTINFEEDSMDYLEIDDIAPLPLHALIAADRAVVSDSGEKASVFHEEERGYDSLFASKGLDDEDLDEMLKDSDSANRSRTSSGCVEETKQDSNIEVSFTAKHNRMLTELLTHTHLPGISSVDQMHLLAIADTLSHFSSDVMDKLTQANAVIPSVLGDSAAGGYATAAAGVETVDECGLRYLMAMKQHEYLLVCLPMKQRIELKKQGLSSSHIIWAQHSDTESELLNAVPVMQKANPTWDELRNLGAAWWLKNTASLRICIEKLAKAAFQQNQDPMDASLYYLALRKKNVLTHLFKTSRNQQMADFFSNDFSNDHWKKVAAKNAFVLMSKQRFVHAAAFFLLSGSLKDAVQTILTKCNDLQLAMVVVRLYESDIDSQQMFLRELLCREVLGVTLDEFEQSRGSTDDDSTLSKEARRDPFERSMAYWCLKDYSRAASTLLDEANALRNGLISLSDIFNFYSFLRKHPLVVRQRLTDAGAQVGSTEKFIAVGKQMESMVSPYERRLFFRTAAEHMAKGCPMLALEVLSRLPRSLCMVVDGEDALRLLLQEENGERSKTSKPKATMNNVDWSAPTNVIKEDELDLGWSDDNDDDLDEYGDKIERKKSEEADQFDKSDSDDNQANLCSQAAINNESKVDIVSQHLKFVASLRIMTEELSTLASGYEVDGGQLRYQLFTWLEKEVEVLKTLCDYQVNMTDPDDLDDDVDTSFEASNAYIPSLHEVVRNDHVEMVARLKNATRRRKWLTANQKLLRSFTSYCALHSAQNHRLTSALMELLLLLLEVQKDTSIHHLSEAVPDINSFPLLEASVSSTKMFVSSPLSFIENQCRDLLDTMASLVVLPSTDDNLQKAYLLYNLSQGLSSCLYQSLCDVDHYNVPNFFKSDGPPGALTRRARFASTGLDDLYITTSPTKWPGVDSLVALLGREKDDEAPQLRLLLIECFVAITMSLFCFALAAHDSRWLFRLASHKMDEKQFGLIFGGGGVKKLKTQPPSRPPRPNPPRATRTSESGSVNGDADGEILRSKLHSKVFGSDAKIVHSAGQSVLEQTISKWVPPHKNIVQLFADKPSVDSAKELGVEYDSDNEEEDKESDSDEESERTDYAQVTSYAWELLRLALIEQQINKIKDFLLLAGFDLADIPGSAPRIEAVLHLLDGWAVQVRQKLKMFPGGCPVDIIPNMTLDLGDSTHFKKYSLLIESGNTPFESDDPRVLPVKRLWAYLVRQENLQNIFILHIYSSQGQQETPLIKNDVLAGNIENQPVPDAFKIIQKDSEPICAFACNQDKPGWLVVSNGRELQEMDISSIFEEGYNGNSWMYNRTELDMQLQSMKREPFKENDDYQLFTDSNHNGSTSKQAHMQLTTWIVDRSRRGLNKMFKRTVHGIRRIDSHPTAPFYVTGSTDGSIRVWEWGAGQPVYTARVAGQYAKVSKITFSCNGNKFAAVDGDGMLCLWQACHATDQKKPFFSQRCHNKSASDVRFLGHSSSVLLTAGCSTGDYNLGLWDTLLPQNRALVHSWIAHPEGAVCAMYLPSQQTIVSGGRHGEISLWDIRQRQLRATVKAFEPHHIVKTLVTDYSQDLIVAGSSEGDIKIWSADSNPQLMYALTGEHAAKSGFSFRQVGQQTIQGVQQLYIDANMRLFSCGADATLKFRTLPSVYNMNIL